MLFVKENFESKFEKVFSRISLFDEIELGDDYEDEYDEEEDYEDDYEDFEDGEEDEDENN